MPDSGLTDNVSFYTSTFHDTYVRQQVVSTCTSGTRPTGVEGRCIYETDTDLLLTYSGAAWVAFAGPITGGTTYTPTVTQGASVNIAKTVTYSSWRYVGFKTIHWSFRMTMTASGTAGSGVTLTVPVTASVAEAMTGAGGQIFDASVPTSYTGIWQGVTTTTLGFNGDWSAGSTWGVTPSLALASSDVISGSITYQIA